MGEFMKRLPTALHSDGSEKISSKRVIAFVLLLTFVVVIFATTFFGVRIDSEIYNGLVEVLIWAIGFIGSEHFASAMAGRNGRASNNRERNPEADLPTRPGGEDGEQ